MFEWVVNVKVHCYHTLNYLIVHVYISMESIAGQGSEVDRKPLAKMNGNMQQQQKKKTVSLTIHPK